VLDDLSLYESCTSPVLLDELPIEQLFPSTAALEIELANEQAPSDELLISVFEPFCHTPLVGGRRIVAIVPIGYQPIIDTTIPRYNNYKAGGVFHHNSGKTVVGAYETVCHATGRYPPWWKGKRFAQPTRGWVAGDTAKTVRDIGQRELLGSPQQFGTGMIPGEDIIRATPKAGVPDAIDTIYVKHYDSSGEQDGVSEIGLKSYDQGRIAFQGTEQDYIWLDEECPMEVYIECLMRTMTTGGIIYLTFTPLRGITEVVLLFMPGGKTQ
jgi:phage terminase large subunit-like protein